MIREAFDPARVKGPPPLRHEGVDAETERLAVRAIGAAIEVHRALGPGYSECVYEQALAIELSERGLPHVRQRSFAVQYKGQIVGEGRLDIDVDNLLILELKAVEALTRTHEAQVASYLKANQRQLGLLINFNVAKLTDGLKRIIREG